MGQDLSCMNHEKMQDVPLFVRQFHLRPAHHHQAPGEVYLEVLAGEHSVSSLFLQSVAKGSPYSRDQLGHSKRLHHIVVRPEVQRLDLPLFAATARQHDDHHLRTRSTQN
jgi:hypothetical protein